MSFASLVLLNQRSGSVVEAPSEDVPYKPEEHPVHVPNIPCSQPQAYLSDI